MDLIMKNKLITIDTKETASLVYLVNNIFNLTGSDSAGNTDNGHGNCNDFNVCVCGSKG